MLCSDLLCSPMHRGGGNLSCMRQRDFGWVLWILPSDRSQLSYLGRESGKGDYPAPSKHVFRSMVELAILSPIGDNLCTQIFMELGPYLWLHDIDSQQVCGTEAAWRTKVLPGSFVPFCSLHLPLMSLPMALLLGGVNQIFHSHLCKSEWNFLFWRLLLM